MGGPVDMTLTIRCDVKKEEPVEQKHKIIPRAPLGVKVESTDDSQAAKRARLRENEAQARRLRLQNERRAEAEAEEHRKSEAVQRIADLSEASQELSSALDTALALVAAAEESASCLRNVRKTAAGAQRD